jgi:hypothetical protein
MPFGYPISAKQMPLFIALKRIGKFRIALNGLTMFRQVIPTSPNMLKSSILVKKVSFNNL